MIQADSVGALVLKRPDVNNNLTFNHNYRLVEDPMQYIQDISRQTPGKYKEIVLRLTLVGGTICIAFMKTVLAFLVDDAYFNIHSKGNRK